MKGNYKKRAINYKKEFNTKEDFKVIKFLLNKTKGRVLDIPCGAGRLLPLYKNFPKDVILVDKESKMINKCRTEIQKEGLSKKIKAYQGNIKSWTCNKKFNLILVPRGGLQLLPNKNQIKQALKNLKTQLNPNGEIYIDLHLPWGSNKKEASLPSFMQFNKDSFCKGVEKYQLPNKRTLVRKYKSFKKDKFIKAKFEYVEKNNKGEVVRQYEAKNSWTKITINDIFQMSDELGLTFLHLWGDYSRGTFQSDSPRVVAVLQGGKNGNDLPTSRNCSHY